MNEPSRAKNRRFSGPQYGRSRRGVSLIEVLMSVGIIGVGLLGVVALFPVAGRQASQGAQADRVAQLGRRYWREFFVRGLHDKSQYAGSFDTGLNYCIDPLYFEKNTRLDSGSLERTFPDTPSFQDPLLVYSNFMPRKTIALAGSSTGYISPARAREIFMCADELVFNVDDTNRTKLPTQSLKGNAQRRRDVEGKYSWFAMILGQATMSARLAVIIVKQRDTSIPQNPNEGRLVQISQIVGGEAVLTATDDGDSRPNEVDVKSGEWVFLFRSRKGSKNDSFADWYRVTATGEPVLSSGQWNRNITVEGPDFALEAAQNIGGLPDRCVLVKGAVGVYCKTLDSVNSASFGMFGSPNYTAPPP